MERLRVELRRECDDRAGIDPHARRAVFLPGLDVLEIPHPRLAMSYRERNQAPPATAPATVSPYATRARDSAANSQAREPVSRKASQPPPIAIARRNSPASSGQPSRPAPSEAKYSARPTPKHP